jgi:hypothetical protein
MTLKELSQLYYLQREIAMDTRRLVELRAKAESTTGRISGMPGGGTAKNKLEQYAIAIVDLEAIITAKQMQCIHERNRLERYIADIPDSLTRQVFYLRFVNGLTWSQVAHSIGGGNTAASVKMICYRYIAKK